MRNSLGLPKGTTLRALWAFARTLPSAPLRPSSSDPEARLGSSGCCARYLPRDIAQDRAGTRSCRCWGWLHMILRNVCRTRLREGQGEILSEELPPYARIRSPEPSPKEVVDQ